MGLFKFRKKAEPPRPAPQPEEMEIYSGMRVEVTACDGRMLFVAKLMGLHGDQAELHQYLEAAASPLEAPFPVRIRGYSDRDRKAVYMEGVIAPLPQSKWAVTELKLCRVGNDRAFFRLATDLPATAAAFTGLMKGERPCRLLNISVGGAGVSSAHRYYEGDKFLLKVRLLEDRPESVMFSEVVRVIEREDGTFEYGCRFLELTEDDESQITRNIFAAQRERRGRGL